MDSALEFIKDYISAFDIIVVLIIIYSMAQCTAKGFTLSLLSFSKWLIALVITIKSEIINMKIPKPMSAINLDSI